jgi:hypothetical protein
VQSTVLAAAGWAALGEPRWPWTGLQPGTVFPLQIGFVLLGTIGALAVARGISEREHPARPGLATLPWAVLFSLLAAAGLWIFTQPMEMRGMGFSG